MLILKSLSFQNIGRFVEPQTIDFTSLGSLVQLEGRNNNTGGSSGAGKSTIAKAISWLLGLDGPSTTVLQSRLTKDQIQVSAIFDYDGQNLLIERGKKLSIVIDGVTTTGSSKLTEEVLDQIIGMPRELFSKILHKAQGSGGFFLDLGPAQTHKFLTSCRNLDTEQSKVVVLDSRLEILEKTKNEVLNSLDVNKSGLDATQKSITILGPPPTLEIDPKSIEGLKNDCMVAKMNHIAIEAVQSQELKELELSRPELINNPFDRSAIQSLENEISTIVANIVNLEKLELSRQSEIKSKISELKVEANRLESLELSRQATVKSQLDANKLEETKAQYLINEGNRAKLEASILAAELQKIRSSICPTCRQSWTTDAAKAKESEILLKIRGYKEGVVTGIEAGKKIDLLKEQRSSLELDRSPKPIPELGMINQQIDHLNIESFPQIVPEVLELKLKKDFKDKELQEVRQLEQEHQFKVNAKYKLLIDEFELKRTNLLSSHEEANKFHRDTHSRLFSLYESAKMTLKSFEENTKRFEEQFNKLNQQMLVFNDHVVTKNLELAQVEEEIELATQAKKAIKSYLSCSFEDALDSIGDTATRLIRSIPNMANSTIQFEGLKETKEGKIKEEVTCVLSMDGEIAVPIKSLSGGERSSADLAIDLAVIKFIEECTGKGCKIMILDEPFTGLDSQNILEALEMLKECSNDKQLLIVDHNPVAAQSIENRLTVIRDGLTSRIVQQ